MTWYRIKLGISEITLLDMDMLHVLVGMLALAAAAAIMRQSIAGWWPWSAVLAAELLNEWNDLYVERWPALDIQLGEGARDILLTMALPTLLMVMARIRPTVLVTAQPTADIDQA